MLSPKRALALLGIAFCIGNISVTLMRSGIPYVLSGTVSEIEVVDEKQVGIDEVWLVTVGETSLHLDNDVAALLHEGDQVEKRAWGRTITFEDRDDIVLAPSIDFWGMFPALGILGAAVWFLEKKRGAAAAPRSH